MEENSILEPAGNESNGNGGFFSWLIHTAKGFIYSCFSPSFYREAIKRSLISAIAFFFIFALAITLVQTLLFVGSMRGVGDEIQGAYDRGEFPTIVIKDGIAEADGPQPLIFEDKRTIFAIDTTGGMKEIDTRSYSRGFLLTRTELHALDDDGYQVLPLIELNELFGNPIVIDKTQALSFWRVVSIWIAILAFVGIFIWTSVVRLAYIALVGLIIWGLVSISKKGIGFSTILITGIFANVPVIYLISILKLVNISFFLLYTILLVAIWALVLWIILERDGGEETTHTTMA